MNGVLGVVKMRLVVVIVVFDNNRDGDDGGGSVRIASCVAAACGGRRSRVRMLGDVEEAAAAIEGAISAFSKV